MSKKNIFFALLFFGIGSVTWLVAASEVAVQANNGSQASMSSTQKIVSRSVVEEEGRKLLKLGRYDEAITRYREALDPKYRTQEWEIALAKYAIHFILKLKGDYKEALDELEWHLEMNPEKYDPAKKELEALIKFRETGDVEFIEQYIEHLRAVKKLSLPPYAGAPSEASSIIRLYDTIGDYDAGIAFIDEVLAWAYQNEKALESLKNNRIKTAAEAVECASKDKRVEERNPNWRGCSWLAEYLLVREAFEKDKAEDTKGRATKALIQSNYFPW